MGTILKYVKHASVGTNLTQTEFEAADSHITDDELLPVLLKGGNLLHIPTNAGWVAVTGGTGSTNSSPFAQDCRSGGDAASTALLTTEVQAWTTGAVTSQIDWDKKLYMVLNVMRFGNVSTSIGRFQVKEVNTIGALAAKGIGIRVDNFTLVGESFGSGGIASVDLATTLTANVGYRIAIVHYPGSKIEWYVNGVLKGTQSTAGNIPSGLAGTGSYLAQSIINGATATDARIYIGSLKLWQEA